MTTLSKPKSQKSLPYRILCFILSFSVSFSAVLPPSHAQSILNLPVPGTMVSVTSSYAPMVIKGIKVFPDNPFRFDFILDTGDSDPDRQDLDQETKLLVKYFLAALTVPDEDQWVNLSPYEDDRIIPNEFGMTEMGRDLLAQDYLFKQLTASMVYPEGEVGKKFWDRVYNKAYEKYGQVDIPVSTFNKVWIIPDRAKVYEHGAMAMITESHLKVMLEEDYMAFMKNNELASKRQMVVRNNNDNTLGSEIMREVILPELEKEINEGSNFAKLRQIYHSLILAAWFKRKLKNSILSKMYVGANKVAGVDVNDKKIKEKIYNQYLAAYKKGVYNYVKEEIDTATQEVIPRRYFSGGFVGGGAVVEALNVEVVNAVGDFAMMSQSGQKGTLKSASVDLVSLQAGLPTRLVIGGNAMVGINPMPSAGSARDRAIVAEPIKTDDLNLTQREIASLNSEALQLVDHIRSFREKQKYTDSMTHQFKDVRERFKAAKTPDEIRYFARVLKEAWPENIGSVFDFVSLVLAEADGLPREVLENYNWIYSFLEEADPVQKAQTLAMMVMVNNLHLRIAGLHPETEDNKFLGDLKYFLDNELLLGRSAADKALLQQFILSVVNLSDPDLSKKIRIARADSGRSKNVDVTLEDLLLWALVLAVDPTIHNYRSESFEENERSADFSRLWKSYWGGTEAWEPGTYRAGFLFLQRGFSNLKFQDEDVKSRFTDMLVKALNRSEEDWEAKGLRSPYRIGLKPESLVDALQIRMRSLNEEPMTQFREPLFGIPVDLNVFNARSNGLNLWLTPHTDSKSLLHLGLRDNPNGLRSRYIEFYTGPMAGILPDLAQRLKQLEPATADQAMQAVQSLKDFVDITPLEESYLKLVQSVYPDERLYQDPSYVTDLFRSSARNLSQVIIDSKGDMAGALVAGYYRGMPNDQAFIHTLAVRESDQRKGLARRMLAAFAREAQVAGKRTVKLGTSDLYPDAIRLYRDLGFEQTSQEAGASDTFYTFETTTSALIRKLEQADGLRDEAMQAADWKMITEERRRALDAAAIEIFGQINDVVKNPKQFSDSMFSGFSNLAPVLKRATTPEEIRYLARTLNNDWPKKYGSVFDFISVVLGEASDLPLGIKANYEWIYTSLEVADPVQKAQALATLVFSNNIHMRYLGLHPETSTGDTTGDLETFLDNELLVGRRQTDKPLLQRFILSLLDLSDGDLTRKITFSQKEAGQLGNLNVTLEDILLWSLVLGIDPAIYMYKGKASGSGGDFDQFWLRHWGEAWDPQRAPFLFLQRVFGNDQIIERKQQVEDLMIKAVSISEDEWTAKGLRSPYRVGFRDAFLHRIIERKAVYLNEEPMIQFSDPLFGLALNYIIFSSNNALMNFIAPNDFKGESEGGAIRLNFEQGLYPRYREFYMSDEMAAIFPELARTFAKNAETSAGLRSQVTADSAMQAQRKVTAEDLDLTPSRVEELDRFADDLVGKIELMNARDPMRYYKDFPFFKLTLVPELENARTPDEIRYLARSFRKRWTPQQTQTFGSFFNFIALMRSEHDGTPQQVKDNFEWVYHFLDEADDLERAQALWAMVLDANAHMREFGVHPDNEKGHSDINGNYTPDYEAITGVNLNDKSVFKGLLQRYVLALLELKKHPEFDKAFYQSEDLNVTNEDFYLWGLVLAVDPTIYTHAEKLKGDAIDAYWSKHWGDSIKKEEVYEKFLSIAFEHEELRNRKGEIMEMLTKALSVSENMWNQKGFISPYRKIHSGTMGVEFYLRHDSYKAFTDAPNLNKFNDPIHSLAFHGGNPTYKGSGNLKGEYEKAYGTGGLMTGVLPGLAVNMSAQSSQDQAMTAQQDKEFRIFGGKFRYEPFDPLDIPARQELIRTINDSLEDQILPLVPLDDNIRSRNLRFMIRSGIKNATDAVIQELDAVSDPGERQKIINDARLYLSVRGDFDSGNFALTLSDSGKGIDRLVFNQWKAGDFGVTTKPEKSTELEGGSGNFIRIMLIAAKENLWKVSVVSKRDGDSFVDQMVQTPDGQREFTRLLRFGQKRGTSITISSGLLARAQEPVEQEDVQVQDRGADQVMSSSDRAKQAQSQDDLGGINMNQNALDLQTEGAIVPFDIPFDPAQWQNIQFDGFTPVILEINPTSLPVFIGATEADQTIQLSSV